MAPDPYAERRLEAVRFARNEVLHGAPIWFELCQKFTRTASGDEVGGAKTAIAAWRGLDRAAQHSGPRPPFGVPVYWAIGKSGHAAVSAGKGYVYSTDIKRRGHVDKVSIDYICRHWGAHYLGWAETINGRRMWPH